MSDHSISYDYVFGFGSIMDTSTHATWQTSDASSGMLGSIATISKSFGYQRQWNFRSSTGFTALGVSKADREGERCDINGVLFQVPTDEMSNFDRREAGYERVSLPLELLTFHPDICGTHEQAQFHLTHSDRIWIYIPLASHTMYADENHPLLQSYVDTVLRGCLDWGGELMAEEFLLTTGGWSCHFLNDTPSSRRPWLHRKEYNTIDALLMKHSQKTHFGDRRHPEEFAASFNQRMRGTWSMPQRNPNFTGRDHEITQLHSRFMSQDMGRKTVVKVEVAGFGGVGKTQLVSEYCYRHDPTSYGLVLWVNAETADSMVSDYRQLLADLASDSDTNVAADMDKTTEDVIAEVKTRLFRSNVPWLLVLDNLEDRSLLDKFIPHGAGSRGHVLITTRHVDVESGSEHFGSLALGCFSTNESLELLRRSVGAHNMQTSDESAAIELANRLGNLPLALGIAGAYMRKCDVTISEYLERYSDQSLLHDKLNDYALTVASSLSLSLEAVGAICPVACEVLRLLAYLGPDLITKPLLRQLLRAKKNVENERMKVIAKKRALHRNALCTATGGCIMMILLCKRGSAKMGVLAATMLATATIFFSPQSSQSNTTALKKVSSSNTFSSSEYEQADTAWNVLKSFSLLSVKEGKGTVHRLLQQALRSCQSAEQYTLNITICIEALSSSWTFQASRVDSWKESLQLHEHVKTVVSYCVDCQLNRNQMMQAAQLSKDSAVFSALTLNAFADAKTSLDLSLRLYAKSAKCHGLQKKRAETLQELGRIFRYQGMFEDSKASLSESLELFHRLNQKDFDVQNGIATSLHEIGLLELKQHNLVDAEAHLLESLRLRRKNSKQEECYAAIAATLHQIAAVYVARKPPLLDKAKSLLLEALGLCSQSGERAATLKQLARVTIRQGQLELAESYLEKALELYNELYDNKNHMNMAAVQYQRGALALQQERFDDAWLHFTEALRIRRHVYSYARSPKDSNPVHMEVSCVLHELGCVWFARGSYAQSKDMFSQEKEILIKLEEAQMCSDRIHQARLTNVTWLRKCAKELCDDTESSLLSKERTFIKRQAQGNSVEHQDDRFVAPMSIVTEAMQTRSLARKFALERTCSARTRNDMKASLTRLQREIDNASNDESYGAIVEFRDTIVTHIDSTAENYRSEVLHACDVLRDVLRSRGIKVHDSFLTGK